MEVCDSNVCGLNYGKNISHLKIHYEEHKMNFIRRYEIRTGEISDHCIAVWCITLCIFSFLLLFLILIIDLYNEFFFLSSGQLLLVSFSIFSF